MIFFGTDGIRGTVGEKLTQRLAFLVGKILGRKAKTLLVGVDGRLSGEGLMLALSCGATSEGCEVTFVGVVSTCAVSYLTKTYKYDYGIMISASHNPPCDNGIKIFGSEGLKLTTEEEEEIENELIEKIDNFNDNTKNLCKKCDLGRFFYKSGLKTVYQKHLFKIFKSVNEDISGLKIVIDGAYGGAGEIAKRVFTQTGAQVKTISCLPRGEKINIDCGSLHPEKLCQEVVKFDADFGFALDGDGDRIVAVSRGGKVLSGEQTLFVLTKYLHDLGKSGNIVVGTVMSNLALAEAAGGLGLKFVATNVGDALVEREMTRLGALIGGEPSGHIILHEFSNCGDGTLCALLLSCALVHFKERNKDTTLLDIVRPLKPFAQRTLNFETSDKQKLLASPQLKALVLRAQKFFDGKGRIVVRASGTEEKVRIMIEASSQHEVDIWAKEFVSLICKN